jgi:N-acetylglucosaminyl-diphospho-decaprenol L-rhamnosyltransferase
VANAIATGKVIAHKSHGLARTPRLDRTSMPHVAVIIVSYGSVSDICECLSALEQSTYANFRVVICENGGEEAYGALISATPARLKSGQRVEAHLAPDNLGYAGGVNFCLRLITGADAYWILNPDTRPRQNALSALVERLARNDCDAVGHDIVLPTGKLASRGGRWREWSAQAISLGNGEIDTRLHDPSQIEGRMNYIIGASMLVSAAFVARTGPLKEDYFLYCEEIEWCIRATRLGLRLGYSPEAVVVHSHGASTGGGGPLNTRSRLAVYLVERNRLLLTRDMFSPLLPIAAALALLHILIKYGKARAWRQVRYALSGWLAGVRNERGKPSWWATSQFGARLSLQSTQSGRARKALS